MKSPDGVCYRLKQDDPAFKLKADDILVCVPYPYDSEKLTVVRRASDGFDPCCNVYKSQVERIKLTQGTHYLRGGASEEEAIAWCLHGKLP